MTNEQDRKDLKIQALLNKLSSKDNEIADLQVILHETSMRVQELEAEIAASQGESQDEEKPADQSD